MRLIFMGSPEFAVPSLDALAEAGFEIAAVYTAPPRPAGRGHHRQRSAVQQAAMARDIEVRTPTDLKDENEQREFAELNADAAVVVAYGLILPPAIFQAPRLGTINVHASLLPRWRGAAPIPRAILAGDDQTGITIMQINSGLDTGDILAQERVPITDMTTAVTLHEQLSHLGARMIVEALDGLDRGILTATPQPIGQARYASKLDRTEGYLDWRHPAAELQRQVRALIPWPGAWFSYNGVRIKVLGAEAVRGRTGAEPGLVLDDRLTINCGDGGLRLTRLQRQGRAPMVAADFLNGFNLGEGDVLSARLGDGDAPATEAKPET